MSLLSGHVVPLLRPRGRSAGELPPPGAWRVQRDTGGTWLSPTPGLACSGEDGDEPGGPGSLGN